jgi:V8-like Glu-specific endopeptidase
VSSRLLLTNQHCISSADEMRSALVDFNYDSDTASVNTITCTEIVAVDEDLDYSLLRLASSPSATPMKLTSEYVSDTQSLLIIQHPGGDPKQVSIVECKVLKASVPGVSGQTTDFGHYCDTLGGSSGSPVQNIATGMVVGLHHLGIPENSTTLTNQAIKMALILKSLTQKSPAVLGEIGMGAKN